MNTSEGITLSEISRLAQHSLRILNYADILQLKSDKEVILRNLRKLYIASLLGDKTVICIAGLQGAGKTTMMRKFYGLDERYLPGTQARGERIPVLFTEKDVKTPELYACKVYKKGDEYVRTDVRVEHKNYKELTNGTDDNIMYLNLVVPNKYTNSDNIVMMLLPGFEMEKNYWEELIEFSLNSSDAAVCVCDEVRFATEKNEMVLNNIKKIFGKDIVFALSHSDESIDNCEKLKKIVMSEFDIQEFEKDRVVCVGSYGNEDKNKQWIEALKFAVQKHSMPGNSRQKNADFLNKVVEDIRAQFLDIRSELQNSNTCAEITKKILGNSLLNEFDKELADKRKEFQKNLSQQYEAAKAKSGERLEKEFTKKSFKAAVKNVGRIFFGTDVQTQFVDTRKKIELALGIGETQKGEQALPDKYLRLALENSLRTWEQPDLKHKTTLARLLETEEMDGHKHLVLKEDGKTEILADDVCNILAEYDSSHTIPQIKCDNQKRLMRAIVEMGTYYLTMAYYDELSEKIGLNYYSPVESELNVDKVVTGAQECKKLMVGLAGVAGLDILEGGGLDFATKISSAFGIAAPAGAAIVAGVIATGAVCAVVKDINKMKCADFLAAKKAVNNIYDSLENNALDIFDSSMDMIRRRISDNLEFLDGDGQKGIYIQNLLIELNNALNLLNEITFRQLDQAQLNLMHS